MQLLPTMTTKERTNLATGKHVSLHGSLKLADSWYNLNFKLQLSLIDFLIPHAAAVAVDDDYMASAIDWTAGEQLPDRFAGCMGIWRLT